MKKNALLIGFAALFALLFFYGGRLWSLFMPIFGALVLTYLAHPFVNFLAPRIPRILGAILFYLIIFGFLALLIAFILPTLLRGIQGLSDGIPEFEKKISELIPFMSFSSDTLSSYLSGKADNIVKILSDAFSFIASATIAVVLSFFFLMDTKSMENGIISILPSAWLEPIGSTLREIDVVFKSFIRGQLLVSLILSTITFLTLLFLKIKYSLILALLYGIFCLIPTVGPFIGAVPVVAISYLHSPATALWALSALIGAQILDNILLSPKIKADSVDISPTAAALYIYLGSGLFGFFGILFGVPIFASLKIILRRVISAIS